MSSPNQYVYYGYRSELTMRKIQTGCQRIRARVNGEPVGFARPLDILDPWSDVYGLWT